MTADSRPKLKMIQLPIFRVHYQDLERYIETIFGFQYDLLFAVGCVNGMCPEYQASGVIPATMNRQVADLRSGRRTKNVNLIMNVLVADKYIPAGRYIIDTHKRPDPTEVYRSLLLRTRSPESAECRRFKAEHQRNTTLMNRVKTLDATMRDQRRRGRRRPDK